MQQGEHHDVVHHLEAGVVAGDQVRHRDAQQFAEDLPQFGQPVQTAVVAGVGALAVAVRAFAAPGQLEQRIGQVQLLGRRLAAGQVELEPPGLQFGVVALLLLVLGLQFRSAEGEKRHHGPFDEQRPVTGGLEKKGTPRTR